MAKCVSGGGLPLTQMVVLTAYLLFKDQIHYIFFFIPMKEMVPDGV